MILLFDVSYFIAVSLYGQIQYFLEVIIDGNIVSFAAISPIHCNNDLTPKINSTLKREITNLKKNDILHFVPAHQFIGIVSLFPLQKMISEERTYMIVPYKFQIFE